MSAENLPPPTLRPIAHYVKIANEYANRDVVIYYWCLYRAVQDGMKLDKTAPVALNYLTSLLSVLEQIKKDNPSNDALTQDVVAQAHIEDTAQKMFQYAESQDRQAIFNQKVVKAFYTCSYLFDVLEVYGKLDENIASARKYARWRATYIHNCLKAGEQPVPGNQSAQNTGEDPVMNQLNDNFNSALSGFPEPPGANNPNYPNPNVNSFSAPQYPGANNQPTAGGYPSIGPPIGGSAQQPPVPQPRQPISPANFSFVPPQPIKANLPAPTPSAEMHCTSKNLTMDEFMEAKKLTKYALSALDYDDAKTAILNMHKALAILQK